MRYLSSKNPSLYGKMTQEVNKKIKKNIYGLGLKFDIFLRKLLFTYEPITLTKICYFEVGQRNTVYFVAPISISKGQ